MGLIVRNDTGTGEYAASRTIACDVCATVFHDAWPVATTRCGECGVPLCVGCAREHLCRNPEQRTHLAARRRQFDERMTPHRGG